MSPLLPNSNDDNTEYETNSEDDGVHEEDYYEEGCSDNTVYINDNGTTHNNAEGSSQDETTTNVTYGKEIPSSASASH